VPRFIEREFRDLLGCGALGRGFARVRCDACRFERLVPFSCKGRAVCPSCGGRRMAEQAAHLVDDVLPFVPVRQWVLTVPHRLRYRLAFDHALCRAVQGRVALGPRAGARVERLGSNPDAPWVESSRPLQARCEGFDLHGAVAVAGEDRDRLEQLCRYLLRPPIAHERLALRPDGKILVTLKIPWRDGTTHLCF